MNLATSRSNTKLLAPSYLMLTIVVSVRQQKASISIQDIYQSETTWTCSSGSSKQEIILLLHHLLRGSTEVQDVRVWLACSKKMDLVTLKMALMSQHWIRIRGTTMPICCTLTSQSESVSATARIQSHPAHRQLNMSGFYFKHSLHNSRSTRVATSVSSLSLMVVIMVSSPNFKKSQLTRDRSDFRPILPTAKLCYC